MKNITIIDYGLGNIQSLYNTLKFLGYSPLFYSQEKKINSNICILPGVGAFNHAMKLLKEEKIDLDLKNFIKNENNLLIGICLGMQLFFDESSENLKTSGLGIIKGKVEQLNLKNDDIVPNVGWFKTLINTSGNLKYLNQFNKQKFYYVHSYVAEIQKKKNQIATSNYNDRNFCAMATNNINVMGTQFHPEKSSKIGLEFLNILIKNSIN
jgi:glutamine amidotransferase